MAKIADVDSAGMGLVIWMLPGSPMLMEPSTTLENLILLCRATFQDVGMISLCHRLRWAWTGSVITPCFVRRTSGTTNLCILSTCSCNSKAHQIDRFRLYRRSDTLEFKLTDYTTPETRGVPFTLCSIPSSPTRFGGHHGSVLLRMTL